MPATTRTTRPASRPEKAVLPTPRRLLRCLACGTIKKGRGYALCAECYKRNGRLARHWFIRLARKAEREAPQYSYRVHPEFGRACRIYARRRQRARRRQPSTRASPATAHVRRIPAAVTRTRATTGWADRK